MRIICKYSFLFLAGGYVYCMMEVMFRNFSHISMLIAGGMAFVLVGEFGEINKDRLSIVTVMFVGMLVITSIEYIIGYIVNINMKMNVWDYSMFPLNLDGQICVSFSILWFILSFVIVIVYHFLERWFDKKWRKLW